MHTHHDLLLTTISIALAVFGCAASLFLLGIGGPRELEDSKLRSLSAAIAFATGCWAMHFLGMLAYQLPMAVAYDISITLLSFAFVIMGTYPAMLIINRDGAGNRDLLLASCLMTFGICAMHFAGMASLRMQPSAEYEHSWTMATLVVAMLLCSGIVNLLRYLLQQQKVSPVSIFVTSLAMGLAISAIHYAAMAGVSFATDSVSLAADMPSAIDQVTLIALVIGLALLAMLMLLFTTLQQARIRLWNTLLMVGVAELVIMLMMPLLVPADISVTVESLVDTGLLMLLLSPVAWRLQRTGHHLYNSQREAEKNLTTQNAIVELLSLPIDRLDIQEMLDAALKIICNITWLKASSTGAIFLNDADNLSLSMSAQHNLPEAVRKACAKVAHGECMCGNAAVRMQIQHHSPIDPDYGLRYAGMADHGHYIVPLMIDQQLQGVLCLYLLPEHQFDASEVRQLETIGATLSGLIASKRNLEELMLANTVFEHNLTCLMITDANNRVLNVNPVFTSVTGYSVEEIRGLDPSILKSGRQDAVFYQRLWGVLQDTGNWQGEIWNKRKNGSIYPAWLAITTVRDQKGRLQNYIAAFADISEHKHAEERIRQLAYYDSLTGLANRSLFYDRLEQAIIQAKRNQNKLALLFIDLDRFKEVNDTLGHDAGDTLLKTVAARIRSCLREADVLARLGGDEFVVLLKDLVATPESNCIEVCEKISDNIIRRLSEGHDFERYTFYGGGSIGIVIYPDSAVAVSDLIQRADTAMYEAKNAGRNTYRFFNPELGKHLENRLAIGHALRHAIERNELSLVYQPLVEMSDKSIIGAEVLLRWHSKDLGQVSPVEFIPLAEESGLIVTIGEWVIQQACKQLLHWQRNQQFHLHYLAINVSIHQLKHRDFADRTLTLCRQFNIEPRHLELEITEGGLAQYPDAIASILKQLQENGFRLAIDDFGTDYSSLGRLKSFNVDLLKIDRSFVDDMTNNRDDAAIVKAIIDLGNALGLQTLAEGVETLEQSDLLQRLGCSRGQGYLYGKPMPAEQFEQLMLAVKPPVV